MNAEKVIFLKTILGSDQQKFAVWPDPADFCLLGSFFEPDFYEKFAQMIDNFNREPLP